MIKLVVIFLAFSGEEIARDEIGGIPDRISCIEQMISIQKKIQPEKGTVLKLGGVQVAGIEYSCVEDK